MYVSEQFKQFVIKICCQHYLFSIAGMQSDGVVMQSDGVVVQSDWVVMQGDGVFNSSRLLPFEISAVVFSLCTIQPYI